MLHHLPVFEEPISTLKFDREKYESQFDALEYSLNFDRPRGKPNHCRREISA